MTAFNPHEYLNSFTNFESQLHKLRPEDFNLNRIKQFLDIAGISPQNFTIVHVAGTKGKGSSCAFLARILQEAGHKVGLYTSPHLHKVNERIRVLSQENLHSKDQFSGSITDEEIGFITNSFRPFTSRIQNDGGFLTYFEILTAVALCHFERSKVGMVILETGLGGRLDATNAVETSIAVITPVSLDHTKILGDTIESIAFEKAGIIKNSYQKVVIAPQENQAMDVLLARCREFGINPVLVHPPKYENFKIGLKGKHQRINAATAIEVVNILRSKGIKITDEAIGHGLAQVVWPGRFQVLSKDPDLIVDCAHNEASSKALAETMAQEYPGRRVILVLGISEDKDIAAICKALKDNVAHIILSKAKHPRAHTFISTECKDFFGNKPYDIIEDLSKAVEKALQIAQPQDVVLVTGSIFAVAEAIDFLSEGLNNVPV